MSSVQSTRENGRLKRGSRPSSIGPAGGLCHSTWENNPINETQMKALDDMYHSHPAALAARTVLHSQLLSGGLKMVRGGEILREVRFGEVDEAGKRKNGITMDFANHLDKHWLPFARDVVDAFLKWGIAPAVFVLPDENVTEDAVDELKRECGMLKSGHGKKRSRAASAAMLVPIVPALGTFTISWSPLDARGYARRYQLATTSASVNGKFEVDDAASVFVRQPPDQMGNLNSPISCVYDTGSFVAGLVDLAFSSEIARSQLMITTQLRKPDRGADLSAGALFFDSESRGMAANQQTDESSSAAHALEMQAKLCEIMCALAGPPNTKESPTHALCVLLSYVLCDSLIKLAVTSIKPQRLARMRRSLARHRPPTCRRSCLCCQKTKSWFRRCRCPNRGQIWNRSCGSLSHYSVPHSASHRRSFLMAILRATPARSLLCLIPPWHSWPRPPTKS
jgi:hypothetical protein